MAPGVAPVGEGRRSFGSVGADGRRRLLRVISAEAARVSGAKCRISIRRGHALGDSAVAVFRDADDGLTVGERQIIVEVRGGQRPWVPVPGAGVADGRGDLLIFQRCFGSVCDAFWVLARLNVLAITVVATIREEIGATRVITSQATGNRWGAGRRAETGGLPLGRRGYE